MQKSIALILFLFVAPVNADQKVALPENYRQTFNEYLSLDRVQHPDQFIRLFADKTAMQGRDSSGQLPDGSILVAEVYSVKKDEKGHVQATALDRRIRDQFKLIAVMQKRSEFGASPSSPIDTGDWDFATYTPSGEIAPKNLNECRACHSPLADSDFVFSIEHLPVSTIDAQP